MKVCILLLSAMVMLLLSGCGQTGPLYLPKKDPSQVEMHTK